jgi:hypothetical protein
MVPCGFGRVNLDGGVVRSVWEASTYGLGSVGPVGDDEELLPGSDEAQLATGQCLDGGRVVTNAIGLKCESTVLTLKSRDRFGQLSVLAAGSCGLNQSALADDGVCHKDSRCEDQEDARQAAPNRGSLIDGGDLLCAGSIGRP